MIADVRIYTTLPGRLPEFVALYEEKAWPLQIKYLERCLGWYTTVEGELNTVVHIWGYEDQADRERRRNAMAADPAWGAYLQELARRGLLLRMENRITRPTAFFEGFQAKR
ncbi:MAG TPA: NIPSNAP family protein [Acetobacteraceae bacterium]|nr:NIPSNAP family protein [Acetobacteraceae bacterium]